MNGLVCFHIEGTQTCVHIQHAKVVSQVCRDGFSQSIGSPVVQFIFSDFHILAAFSTDCAGLEQKEPCSHRSVSVLKPNRNETNFLAGHLGTGLNGKIGAGT